MKIDPSALTSHSVRTRGSLIPTSWACPVSSAPTTPAHPHQAFHKWHVMRERLCGWTELGLNPESALYQLCDLVQGAFSLCLSFFISQMG